MTNLIDVFPLLQNAFVIALTILLLITLIEKMLSGEDKYLIGLFKYIYLINFFLSFFFAWIFFYNDFSDYIEEIIITSLLSTSITILIFRNKVTQIEETEKQMKK